MERSVRLDRRSGTAIAAAETWVRAAIGGQLVDASDHPRGGLHRAGNDNTTVRTDLHVRRQIAVEPALV